MMEWHSVRSLIHMYIAHAATAIPGTTPNTQGSHAAWKSTEFDLWCAVWICMEMENKSM